MTIHRQSKKLESILCEPELFSELSFVIHRIYAIKPSEALITHEYLGHCTHSGFLRELHDDLRSCCDIDFLIVRTERVEEIFCFYTVGAVVFCVDCDHDGEMLENRFYSE